MTTTSKGCSRTLRLRDVPGQLRERDEVGGGRPLRRLGAERAGRKREVRIVRLHRRIAGDLHRQLDGTGLRRLVGQGHGPETQNWCGFPTYSSAIQGNASAWSAISIIATHEYGCTPAKAFPAAQQAGKEFWETEIYDQVNATADLTMNSGLVVANLMYDALANANMNAWHYWWFTRRPRTTPRCGTLRRRRRPSASG